MIEAKMIKDSISKAGVRICTLQLKYNRYIHGEVMTHRVFSRNASSSRAIPVKTMLSQVWNDPAMPTYWGSNKPGMQAGKALGPLKSGLQSLLWKTSAKVACIFAWAMMKGGLHKQWANRILEPWQYIHVILTSTEWDNFMELRDHPDAQPEILELARRIKNAMETSTPTVLQEDEWHLPYVNEEEQKMYHLDDLMKISVARCCRVSYLKHDGTKSSMIEDLKLFDRLVGAKPWHSSPLEHQATPMRSKTKFSGNLRGWYQYRKLFEKENTHE